MYDGCIHFANTLTQQTWEQFAAEFDLEHRDTATLTASWLTGDDEPIEICDPPNLIAIVRDPDGDSVGLVRCSRMFFDGGVSDVAEVQFQGQGPHFERVLAEMRQYLDGSIEVGPPSG
ncbi:hypothetical protein LOC67_16920 [Stieleria sp. JC731]|uniref:hypothetical protein n=1 Tax=Stieleria sp. JC731 TaxID=2894195 RepID=UPI001E2E5D04|nr:hypothetical protein [Stieleria sp. JC731]MCC9602240.1 hypothetical protein [Stieleria sp. JC731]